MVAPFWVSLIYKAGAIADEVFRWCRGVEELGAYRSRIEQLGVPDSASPRDSDMAMSWPCTPSKTDHRSSPAPGLFRRGPSPQKSSPVNISSLMPSHMDLLSGAHPL